MRAWLPLTLFAVVACNAGLRDGYFVKDGVRYKVATLDSEWQKVDFSDNDLAWVRKDTAQVLAMNATCKDTGDPSLEVLTNHLLMGFTDKWLKERNLKPLDGRDALVSRYDAKLDGVEVELQVAVMKKDDCVYDFSYIAPKGHFEEGEVGFDKLLGSFTTGAAGVANR